MAQVTFTITGKPLGKPRMTRTDRWKKRPCVLRYWAWKDRLLYEVKSQIGKLPEANSVTSLSWTACFAMPKSWSKRKRAELLGQLHRQKPDRDNIDKALLDALYDEDSGIAAGSLRKEWGTEDRLTVTIEHERSAMQLASAMTLKAA